jgi:hypothetical protein
MKESGKRLFAIADLQQGYFTSKQARSAGFVYSTHSYHVKAGNWVREHWGVYRLAQYAEADRPDLVLWSLWSRDRKRDESQGVYSHQTALSLYDLSDLMPSKLHMTVPPGFHRGGKIPGILVLHRSKLTKDEVESRRGFRVTRPLRTVTDLIRKDSVSRDLLIQAVTESLKRGLLSRSEIEKSPHLSSTIRKKMLAILEEIGR